MSIIASLIHSAIAPIRIYGSSARKDSVHRSPDSERGFGPGGHHLAASAHPRAWRRGKHIRPAAGRVTFPRGCDRPPGTPARRCRPNGPVSGAALFGTPTALRALRAARLGRALKRPRARADRGPAPEVL